MRRARENGRGRVKLGPVCLTGSDDVSQTGAWTPRNQGRTLPYQVPGFGGRAVHITPLVVDSLYLNPKQSVSSPSRNSYPFLFCFSSVMVVLNLKPLSQSLAVKAFAGRGRPCDGRGGGNCSLLRGDRRTGRIEFTVYVLAVASLLSTDVLRAL